MKYIVYKITNKLNGKVYIGKHQTQDVDDDYMGSGKLLKRAINKHGTENFTKEILHVFDTEEEMNAKERELVTEDFCLREETYNLCVGGRGGFSYINREGLTSFELKSTDVQEQIRANGRKSLTLWRKTDRYKREHPNHTKLAMKGWFKKYGKGNGPFKGKKHSIETKQKISKTNSAKSIGHNNSQFGTMWITDGTNNKKVQKEQKIPVGWKRGRTIKLL